VPVDRKYPTVNSKLLTGITNAEIEVDIFSGRKNPRLVVGSGFASDLLHDLIGLVELTKIVEAENSYLGYRGFTVFFANNPPFYVPARLSKEADLAEYVDDFLDIHTGVLELFAKSTKMFPDVAETIKSVIETMSKHHKAEIDTCPNCGCRLISPTFSGVQCASKKCGYYHCA
jgi:hypothetical protein